MMFWLCLVALADELPRERPASLEPKPFQMPSVERGELSNGLQVLVVNNPEVPLWEVRLVFDVGGFADPPKAAGLASVTFDMLSEGAGELDAGTLSRQATGLGGTVESGGSLVGGQIQASGIRRNLEGILDLWALVVLEPTFPPSEWELMKARRIADYQADSEEPRAIARRGFSKRLYREEYRGHLATEESYAGITIDQIRDFHARVVGPTNARIVAGGDITLEELLPLLEARIGGWAAEVESVEPAVNPVVPPTPVLYFIDKPGAPQSVINVGGVVGTQSDDDHFALLVANTAFGGAFTGRVNMNLREDKGYSYGVYSSLSYRHGPGYWWCGGSVRADVTLASLVEIRSELNAALGDRPFTADELSYFASYRINRYPGDLETTGAVLDRAVDIWRFGLPEDWPERYVPAVKGVDLESMNTAFQTHIRPENLFWLVVGDKATQLEALRDFDLPIVELDREGHLVGE